MRKGRFVDGGKLAAVLIKVLILLLRGVWTVFIFLRVFLFLDFLIFTFYFIGFFLIGFILLGFLYFYWFL